MYDMMLIHGASIHSSYIHTYIHAYIYTSMRIHTDPPLISSHLISSIPSCSDLKASFEHPKLYRWYTSQVVPWDEYVYFTSKKIINLPLGDDDDDVDDGSDDDDDDDDVENDDYVDDGSGDDDDDDSDDEDDEDDI
jgi:hypothetical protein